MRPEEKTMATFTVPRLSVLCAAALGLAIAPASAKVGVTSAVEGDPRGKPPSEVERVLRIGIDVQSNELITTGTNDRAHLVFLDGTSVTVGPNAQLTIDKFVYDPDTKKGDLAITAGKGVFRLVGGKISKSNAITVTTPSSTMGIRGGITTFTVTLTETMAAFIFGTDLTMTAGGRTQTITRPGYQISVSAGGTPGAPTAIPKGGLAVTIAMLENSTPPGNGGPGSSGGPGGNADQRVQSSGFANQNESQANNMQRNSAQQQQQQQQQRANGTNNPTTNAVSGANTQVQTDTASQSTTPAGPTPIPRTSQAMSGFISGLIDANSGGNVISTSVPKLDITQNVTLTTDAATNTVSGTFALQQNDAVSSVAIMALGGTPTSSAFVNDKNYAVTTTDQLGPKGSYATFNPGPSVFLGLQHVTGVLSSGLRAQPDSFGSCTCEFMSWGVWSTAITVPTGPRAGQIDIVNLAPYVAGVPTTQLQMPQTGGATYAGGMMGQVWNNGVVNTAATGSYTSTWDFVSRAGTFNGSFDGAAFTGNAAAPFAGSPAFTGTITSANGTGAVSGNFFNAPGDVAKYQAGSFSIGGNSTSYRASGVFAGQRP
jgi:hypothetical protein